MHRKHVIDPGTEVTEGSGAWGVGRVFRWGLRCPLLRKSYNVLPRLQHNCTAPYPWFSGFGSMSFQSVLPAGLFNCSQPPDVDVPTVDCRNNVCRNRVCRNSVVYPSVRCSGEVVAVFPVGSHKPATSSVRARWKCWRHWSWCCKVDLLYSRR